MYDVPTLREREREYVVCEGSGVWQGRLLSGPVSHPLTELVKDKVTSLNQGPPCS